MLISLIELRPRLRSLLIASSTVCLSALNFSLAEDVQFARDIQPILAKNCVACHSSSKTEGGLNLESHSALMAGGDSGESVVPETSDESYLLTRVIGEDDEIMPPDENDVGAKRLTPSEINRLRTWIVSGAKNTGDAVRRTMKWRNVPEILKPTYSLAVAADGQFLAYGSGNTVHVEPLPGSPEGNETRTLMDSSLESHSHLDLVHAVAISPDSQLIASGGYRCVKLWRKKYPIQTIAKKVPLGSQQVAYSSDRHRMAFAHGNSITILDLESVASTELKTGESDKLVSITWLPINSTEGQSDLSFDLVACDDEGKLLLLSTSGHEPTQLEVEGLTAKRILATSATNLLVVDSENQLHRLNIDFTSPTIVASKRFDPYENVLDWSKSERQVALLMSSGEVALLDRETLEESKRFSVAMQASQLVMDHTGNRLAISSLGSVELWDTADAKLIASLQVDYDELQAQRQLSRKLLRQANAVKTFGEALPKLQENLKSEQAAEQEIATSTKKAEAEAADAKTQLEEAQKALTAIATESSQDESNENAENDKEKHGEEKNGEQKKQLEKRLQDLRKAVENAKKKFEETNAALELKQRALRSASASVKRVQLKLDKHKAALQNAEQTFTSLQEQEAVLKLRQEEAYSVSDIRFTQSGQVIIAGSNGTLHVFSSSNGIAVANVKTSYQLRSLFTNPGTQLLGVDSAGRIQTISLTATWELEKTIGSASESPFSDRVTCLDFSPDGSRLAVGSGQPSRNGDLTILDTDTGEVLGSSEHLHLDTLFSVRFSPDGEHLLTAAADKLCHLVRASNLDIVRSFEGHTHHVLSTAWHDSGDRMATASADATVKIWDVESGEQKRTIKGFDVDVTSVAFVGATSQVAIATADSSLQLYDGDNGKRIRTFAGSTGPIFTIAVDPSHTQLSAAGQEGTIWHWQIADGKPISLNNP